MNDFILELDGLSRDNYTICYFTKDMVSKISYRSHIVCCRFGSREYLESYWNELVNLVAIKIQASVPSMAEAYNVYIAFFCENIDDALQFKIEQDKYSSRKIVFKKLMPEAPENLEKLLEERLFRVAIPEDVGRSADVDLYLREKGDDVYALVSNVSGRVQDISDSYINNILAEMGIGGQND